VTAVQTAEARLTQVVAETWPVLLDFDGPVTHLFIDGRNKRLADQLRTVLTDAGVTLSDEVPTTVDPLAILRWSAIHTDPRTAQAVEAACVAGEYQCIAESSPTPGAAELLSACREVGRPTLIVSNNAEGPIRAFLKAHQLDHLDAPASSCAFIGDSVTDIAVSHVTGVRSIGQAKNPRRGQELADAGADALVHDLADLARAITNHGALRSQH
jgi:phosphoglycolate phosphatase